LPCTKPLMNTGHTNNIMSVKLIRNTYFTLFAFCIAGCQTASKPYDNTDQSEQCCMNTKFQTPADRTHFTESGARDMAEIIVEQIKKKNSRLASYFICRDVSTD
jgi:hypothetical protein